MSSKICLSDIMFETTRRCNMRCAHCLRGEAEDVNLNLDHVSDFMSRVHEVTGLEFSGGEPSLVPTILQSVFELSRNIPKPPMVVFMTVNGGESCLSSDFLATLSYMGNEIGSDNVKVFVSNDQFHEYRLRQEVFYTLKSNGFRVSWHGGSTSRDVLQRDEIIMQGRASDFGYYEPEFVSLFRGCALSCEDGIPDIDRFLEVSWSDLYMNVYGEIFTTVDLSYDSQRMAHDAHGISQLEGQYFRNPHEFFDALEGKRMQIINSRQAWRDKCIGSMRT